MIKEERRVNERLYDFAAGCYCGVLMPEKVMKKIAKLNAKFSNEIRKILQDHEEIIHPSNWTLANEMDGDNIKTQVSIRYFLDDSEEDSLKRRIALFQPPKPEYYKDVFRVKNREEAKQIAEEVLQETIEERSENEE